MSSRSFIFSLLQKIAPHCGVEVFQDGVSAHSGYIVTPSSQRFYFKSSRWDVNGAGASFVVNDKTLTIFYLSKEGYQTPNGVFLENSSMEEFRLEDIPMPCIVKPNSQSRSRGLFRVNNKQDLSSAIEKAFTFENKIRVEEEVLGTHLCFGVCSKKVYFVYEKEPFSAGGVQKDVTDLISKEVLEYIVNAVSVFGLRLASVDVVCRGEINSLEKNDFVIIEINSAPSFKMYGNSSNTALLNVENLYTDLLKSL